jgi:hypothetical protein
MGVKLHTPIYDLSPLVKEEEVTEQGKKEAYVESQYYFCIK